jgi:hypothetical protein
MGGCCSTQNTSKKETNLTDKGSLSMNANQLATIIKAQAAFRGLITRKQIRSTKGFACSEGLMKKRWNVLEMDPETLARQREKVQEIKSNLPQFVYDQD